MQDQIKQFLKDQESEDKPPVKLIFKPINSSQNQKKPNFEVENWTEAE